GAINKLIVDAAVISNKYFGAQLDPEKLDLKESPALKPTVEQLRVLRQRYEQPSERSLYYRRDRLSFDEMMVKIGEIRAAL
ncbi:MAG TPA: hypothetical protein VJS39_00960, partial [Gemmatimonadaceae bacterium]|nr:hypothetical protein [Gemmatimonadaceae bacterium]